MRSMCHARITVALFLLLPAAAYAQAAAPAPTPTEPPAEAPPLAPAPAVVAAPPPPAEPAPAPAPAAVNSEAPLENGPVPVKGLWSPTFYGFVEFDAVHDSTESLIEVPANVPLARPGTWAGDHGRTSFAGRNTRFGFRLAAPAMDGFKATALIEADFAGNQPPVAYGVPGGVSENSNITNSTLRVRHAALKLETDYVDVLLGQYWQLFGWQAYFRPSTVEVKGMPGQVFGRAPQVRLSHMFKTAPVNVELAIAAARPPQRDDELPDGQAGLRVLVNDWKGFHTIGPNAPLVDALAIGVSGTVRRIRVPEFSATPKQTHSVPGWGISVDGFIPVIRGTMKDRANSLALTGSFATGTGIADQYLALTGGVTFPKLPQPAGATTAVTYPQNVDNGIVTYDAQGKLQSIDWQSFMGGVQYYLPPSGKVWVAGNVTHMKSDNAGNMGLPPTSVFTKSTWFDVNLFWEVVAPVRLGVAYSQFRQTYADGTDVKNTRVQFNGYYTF